MKTKFKQITDQDLKALNDDLISDIIPLKIDARMSVPTLHALQTIFYLRLQLAQVSWAENEPIYESLCRNRFEQIAAALTEKYGTVETLSDKITILNRLENISQILNNRHSDFAVEQRRKLIASAELTFTQRYRLDNLLEFNYDNVTEDIDRLLAEARTAFDIAILFDIDSLGTEKQYNAVTDLYQAMFDNAIAEGNTREIANLLAVAADSNNDPARRALLGTLTAKVLSALPDDSSENRTQPGFAHVDSTSLKPSIERKGIIESLPLPERKVVDGLTLLESGVDGLILPESRAVDRLTLPERSIEGGLTLPERRAVDELTLPERRVNEIAAAVYTRIDALTGKYAPIPA